MLFSLLTSKKAETDALVSIFRCVTKTLHTGLDGSCSRLLSNFFIACFPRFLDNGLFNEAIEQEKQVFFAQILRLEQNLIGPVCACNCCFPFPLTAAKQVALHHPQDFFLRLNSALFSEASSLAKKSSAATFEMLEFLRPEGVVKNKCNLSLPSIIDLCRCLNNSWRATILHTKKVTKLI